MKQKGLRSDSWNPYTQRKRCREDVNTPDIDPSRGLVALPASVVDASELIVTGCAAGDGTTGSQFTVTGRGGFPSNPGVVQSPEAVWEDARQAALTANLARAETATTPPSQATATVTIVPATSWVFNQLGQVTLTAQVPNATSYSLGSTRATCPAR